MASSRGMWQISPKELLPVTLLGLLLLLNAFAMQVSYVSSISGFLHFGGAESIWIVWIVDYLLIMMMTGGQNMVIDRFDRVTLLSWVLYGFIGIFIALRLMLALDVQQDLVFGALYIVAEQQWLLFPVLFWVLANDSIGVRSARRLFPKLASFGLIGTLLGLLMAGSAPVLLGALGLGLGELLLVNAGIYLVATFLLRRARSVLEVHGSKHAPEPLLKAGLEGARFVASVPSFRYVSLAILALVVCDTLVEFAFLSVTDRSFANQEAYHTFYAAFRISTVVTAFALQAFVTGRLLRALELKNTLLTLPLICTLVLTVALVSPGLAAAVATFFAIKVGGEGIQETARKTLQGFVPEERRGRVSLLMDSYLIAVGTILGSLLIGSVLAITPASGRALLVTLFAVALAFGFFALTMMLAARRVYDSSLLNWRLARRRRTGAAVLDRLL